MDKITDHFRCPVEPTRIKNVVLDADSIKVILSDGRIIQTPLEWFPVLNSANQDERNNFRLSARGIHWDTLDEDIPVETFLDDYR